MPKAGSDVVHIWEKFHYVSFDQKLSCIAFRGDYIEKNEIMLSPNSCKLDFPLGQTFQELVTV